MRKFSYFLMLQLSLFFSCEEKKTEESSQITTDTTTVNQPEAKQERVSLEQKWATDSTLQTPESVLFEDSVYYVSNVSGNPTEKDNKGFISKVKSDGSISNLRWATGLHAPKGMGTLGDKLYVTDIDRLVEIDKKTGKITNKWNVPGAQFLNDIAEDRTTNTLYITDMMRNQILKFENGKINVWLDSLINGPNGLYVKDGKLFVATSGDDDFKSVDLKSKEIKTIVSGIGEGDGVEYTGTGNNFLVSNWEGEVYYITGENQKTKILDTKDQKINSADIEFVIDENLLLVPTFFNNKVVAYELKK